MKTVLKFLPLISTVRYDVLHTYIIDHNNQDINFIFIGAT